jgi:pimeloyl-ACP methyl ester carboxylesterase
MGAVAASPLGRSGLKAAGVLSEILPGPLHPLGALTGEPQVTRIALPHGKADLYERGADVPGVVLVHGANPGGIDDPRVRRLAVALSRVGRTVLAPALTLADRRLDRDDPLRILDAIDALADQTGPVLIVAFSYGAALVLTALEERPSSQARVVAVATIGTYFDLVHLIQGATCGAVVSGGVLHPWQPPATAMEEVTPLLAGVLGSTEAGAVMAAVASGDPGELPPSGRAVYDVIVNRDPFRTEALVGRLPEDIRETLDRLSPARHADVLRVPVYALHSRLDPAAPAVESVELVEAVRRRARARLFLVGSFHHVTPAGTATNRLADAPSLVAFATTILRTQERWLPGRHLG